MTLGQKIQTLRHDAGLSQEGLGEKLGVSRQAISKWEADGAVPEVDKLIALSRLFEVNLHDLLQVEGTSREEAEESGEQPPEEAAENPLEKDQPPRRNGRWWKALCVVLAAAVCVQGVVLFFALVFVIVNLVVDVVYMLINPRVSYEGGGSK